MLTLLIAVSMQAPLPLASRPGQGTWPYALSVSPIALQSRFVADVKHARQLMELASAPKTGPAFKGKPPRNATRTAQTTRLITSRKTSPATRIALQKWGQDRLAAIQAADAAAKTGRKADERQILTRDLLYNPNWLTAGRLSDLNFHEGRYLDAYKDLAAFMDGSIPIDLGLRASIAAARVGEVYPGQREYCLKCLQQEETSQEVWSTMPSGNTAREVAALSHLILGRREFYCRQLAEASFNLSEALKLSGKNPYAEVLLSQIRAENGQYREALDLLSDAESRLPKNGELYRNAVFYSNAFATNLRIGVNAKDKSTGPATGSLRGE